MNDDQIPGLVLNTNKNNSFVLAQKVIDWFQERNISYLMEASAASMMGEKNRANYKTMRENTDFIILFGGDGTFLHTAHHFIGSDIPLMGINLGGLGFLTEIEKNELEKTLQHIYEGNYNIEKRMLLKANIYRKGENIAETFALNDVAINRGANARMVEIKMHINKEYINSYKADGLVVSTPTGSTAYSLSAGGPIINSRVRAILITPICPHNLYMRPMVISENEELMIEVTGDDEKMMVTADGNFDYRLLTGDRLVFNASDKEISMIKLPGRTFYTILREKMKVGLV